MTYDLIIVARSTTPRLIGMTQNCINTAQSDRVIVIETAQLVDYTGVDEYILYHGAFNYNRALNMGLEVTNCDVKILANNDLIFYDGWRSIGEDMSYNGFDSASAWYSGSSFPRGDFIYEGYSIATHITGWCLFITADAMKKIGRLREDVEFWYSDNLYALQLQEAGLRHGLFCNVRVDHIANQTLNTMPLKIKRQYSHGQLAKFNQICGKKRCQS